MTTGKILWFGGTTREGRKNDFGFIQYQINGLTKKIYVNRHNISQELQDICENDHDKGKGIGVNFDIEEYKKKETIQQRAVNVQLIKYFGIIESQNKIFSENCKQYRLQRENAFNQGELLEFFLQNHSVIILRQVEYSDVSMDIIKTFCDNVNVEVMQDCFDFYVSTLDNESAIQYILYKLWSLDVNETFVFVEMIIAKYNDLILISNKIRQEIRGENRTFFNTYENAEYQKKCLACYIKFIQNNLCSANEQTKNYVFLDNTFANRNVKRLAFVKGAFGGN
ncbi:MAG: hypothetical protein ACK58N_03780 [Synechocystis sp.]